MGARVKRKGKKVKSTKEILEEVLLPSLKDVELWDVYHTIKVRKSSTYALLKRLKSICNIDSAGVSFDLIIRAGLSLLVRHLREVIGGLEDEHDSGAHPRGGQEVQGSA